MANLDRVNGFKPVGTLSGGKGSIGWIQKCLVDEDDSTAVAVGDIVVLASGNESLGIPTVAASAAQDVPYGVVVGIENWDGSDSSVTQTLDKPRYRPASVRGYALVAIAPDLVMEAQISTGGDLEDGDIGANADLVAGGVDTAAQTSGMELNYATMAATNTLVFKIIELLPREDNALGAHAKVLCTFNLHDLAGGADTTGSTGSTGVHA
ncbi:MAG: hypothetical protein C4542_08130 [Dehalococcoidia bacterium]|nr:MAG: hypothetical protein C4542_08130 [Dehalococcoidia bacterium]